MNDLRPEKIGLTDLSSLAIDYSVAQYVEDPLHKSICAEHFF